MSSHISRKEKEKVIGVFIKTTLGTRLAVSVPPATTAALLIREVERAHFNCFPSFGEIKVQGFMVKRKSCFYHLSPSMPLTCVIKDCKGPCFLHAKAFRVNECGMKPRSNLGVGVAECSMMTALESELEQKCQMIGAEGIHCQTQASEAIVKENCLANGVERDCDMDLENSTSISVGPLTHTSEKKPHEDDLDVMLDDKCSSENSSATRSVTDIIRRHYSATDTIVESHYVPEMENEGSGLKEFAASPVDPDITPRTAEFYVLQEAGFRRMSVEGKRPDVGQRLLMASSKLGISPANPSPVVSMYRAKASKHFGKDFKIRNPVFELSESTG